MVNLYNVLPTEINRTEANSLIKNAAGFLQERGKFDTTKDEFAFVMTLDRYIELFEKAKSMLANNKFTVEFKGNPNEQILRIEDFEIIPVKT